MQHAIILAAGRGSRLQQLSADQPKCLTQVAGRSLLNWQRRSLRQAGITQQAVVRGYRAEQIPKPQLTCFDNPRWSETNMVRSLQAASSWLSQHVCLVSYADILYAPDAVLALQNCQAELALASYQHWRTLWSARYAEPLSDLENFRVDATGQLLEIGGRAETLEQIQGQYMGLLRLTPQSWQRIQDLLASCSPTEVDAMDMTSLLQRLLQTGMAIATVPVASGWAEIDNEADLRVTSEQVRTDPVFAWLRS